MARKAKQLKLGSGERFEKLTRSIATKGNVRNPEAVAAVAGRKKYGKAKMARLAAAGRKRTAAARRKKGGSDGKKGK